jgi:hypothetical protein
MAALVTYAQAKAHLRLTDDESKTDLLLKMQQATDIVLERIERDATDSPVWTEDTDPENDSEFARAQAMVLMELTGLWRFRGDDVEAANAPEDLGRLSPRAERIAYRQKGPTLA